MLPYKATLQLNHWLYATGLLASWARRIMLHQHTMDSLASLWGMLLTADGVPAARPRLRGIAREASAEARSEGVHIEQLIIDVKRNWATYQDTAVLHDIDSWSDKRLRAEAIVSELVSLMIDEYYRRPTENQRSASPPG